MNNTVTPPMSARLACVAAGLDETRPATRLAFSEDLRELARQFADRPAMLAAILTATQGRGFDLLLVLLGLP